MYTHTDRPTLREAHELVEVFERFQTSFGYSLDTSAFGGAHKPPWHQSSSRGLGPVHMAGACGGGLASLVRLTDEPSQGETIRHHPSAVSRVYTGPARLGSSDEGLNIRSHWRNLMAGRGATHGNRTTRFSLKLPSPSYFDSIGACFTCNY
jgi:hypothetical protein